MSARSGEDRPARLAAAPLALATAAVAIALLPFRASAAFELRDASPAALGAVSMDREPRRFFAGNERRGVGVTASHASLYGVEGLTSEQASGCFASPSLRVDLSHVQVGPPGIREHATRLAIREEGSRVVALSLQVERLALALEGEHSIQGWTLGGGVRGAAALAHVRFEAAITADRVARRGDLGRVAIGPALPWAVRLHAGGAALEVADRWEGNGRTSPRLSLDVRAGSGLALRFGRGERPGRTGAAAALRVGRLEVSVGRQDDEFGGSVSGASVTLLPGGRKP